jgi:uncharacterized membrane protein
MKCRATAGNKDIAFGEAWGMEISQPQPGPVTAAGSGPSAPPPRHLAAGEGAGWWGEGWRIFCAAPAVWIGIFVVFVVVSIALVLVPIIGSLAHTLLTPVFAGGVMLGCHALARGEPLRIGHLFEGFQGGRFGPLCILGLLALAILFVAATVMVATIFLTLGASGLAALMDYGNATFDYQAMATAGAAMVVVALIGATLAALVAMAYWFAPALVVLNGEPPLAALQKSFAASWRNIGAFLLYGLIYIGLAIVATIPMGLGWLVLGPMLVGSCYAGWRTIFAR